MRSISYEARGIGIVNCIYFNSKTERQKSENILVMMFLPTVVKYIATNDLKSIIAPFDVYSCFTIELRQVFIAIKIFQAKKSLIFI